MTKLSAALMVLANIAITIAMLAALAAHVRSISSDNDDPSNGPDARP